MLHLLVAADVTADLVVSTGGWMGVSDETVKQKHNRDMSHHNHGAGSCLHHVHWLKF